MAPRRLPPLYPGQVRRCPNGCPERAPGDERVPVMPAWAPQSGCWLTCCIYCGWVARYMARYGDRDGDICWITQEDVPIALQREVRAWGLRGRLAYGLGPWPGEEEETDAAKP